MVKPKRLRFELLERRFTLNADPVSAGTLLSTQLLRVADFDAALLESPSGPETLEQHWPQGIDERGVRDWRPITTGDFNGDGITDILGEAINRQTGRKEAFVQLNDQTQLFLVPWGESLPASNVLLGPADVNGDGRTDLVSVREATNDLWVAVNDPGSGLVHRRWSAIPGGVDLRLGDFNGDGRDDVLGFESGQWKLATSTDAGSDRFELQDWGPFPQFDWRDVVHGHFDGDALRDVAARAPDDTWWVWRGSQEGLLPAEYWGHWKMASATDWFDVRTGDFNSDGMDDIVDRSNDGWLWVATSVETEFHSWRWGDGWVVGANWSNVLSVDITGDGLLDQIGQAAEGTWWVAENTGRNFRNYFLDRTANVQFAAVLEPTSTTTPEPGAAPVFTSLPRPHASEPEPEHSPIQISIDDMGRFVLRGSGQRLRAIEFRSPGGGLTTAAGSDDIAPFDQLDANDSTRVRVAATEPFVLEGTLTLGVGWNRSSGLTDLSVDYDVVQLQATIDPAIFDSTTADASDPEQNEEWYRQAFRSP